MGIEIQSNLSSSMKKIYEAHWETGNEIGSKNGYLIAMAQRAELKKQKTHYTTTVVDGKRKITYNKSTSRPFGTIIDKNGGTLATKLENFIQWRTYSSTGTTIVAAPMKSGTTEIRRNGRVINSTRVDGVGKGSINILQKLNYGLNGDSSMIMKPNGTDSFNWQGGESMDRFKGTHQKARNFMEEGRRNVMGSVNRNIKQGFADAIKRRENINEPMKKVV